MGINAAGLRPKLLTLNKVLNELKPSVFFIEETKFKDSGKLKIENYDIFELVRGSRDGGGGLAIGCVKELQPVWVREGNDQAEALSVEIFVKNLKIRCCVAYGCQESDLNERKAAFWKYLDEEVLLACNSGSGLVIHFDGNLWAGDGIIPGDPRIQNRNGKLFEEFLVRNPHLSVVNSLPLCEGLITRRRIKNGNIEESVLDFFVICNLVLPHITRMVIDERKSHILTNYQSVKNQGKATDSDHFTEYMDCDLEIINEKPERLEILDFKNKEAQGNFKNLTSNTKDFTNCFPTKNVPLIKQVENWRQILKAYCNKSFKKIRIKKMKLKPINKKISKFIDERSKLLTLDETPEIKHKIEEIDEVIALMEADDNREKIMNNFKTFSENPETLNLQQVWKLNKKLWPKHENTLPIAKMNQRGKLVSNPKELKKVLAREYKDRLRQRPIRQDLLAMRNRRKKIFQLKMTFSSKRRTPDWNMLQLEGALKDLKNNKSRDFEGYVNEIFKADVIGDDLKMSLLVMFNKLKRKKLIAKFMNNSNISTVHKKGSKILLQNERGIFRVSVIRSILMRLIYNTNYSKIDKNMSDCQMGARKGKGCRNNIFILNGIIHEVMKSKRMKPVLFQIYDYRQMFDSIDLEEAISDLFDIGMKDDTLVLVYKANKQIYMAVKTPTGLTERQTLENIVLQGDTWGSILASVQVDSIGKECVEAGYGYKYKDSLPISMLGLVDDTIGVTEAGFMAQQMNAFINVKTAEKSLQFGPKKCKSMLIGEKTENVTNNPLKVDN